MKHLILLALSFLPFANFSAQNGGCIDPDLIDPDIFCSSIYDPVCGCDGVTYSNDCIATYVYGVTSYTSGECSGSGVCFDLAGVDFGECEMAMGVALISGNCSFVSGCGYVVDDVNYSANFFENMDDCQTACETGFECIDLDGIDFGPCDFVLGIGMIDGSCVSVSGCGYIVDEVDYTNNFFETVDDCEFVCDIGGCVDPDQINETQPCPFIFDPVCGCNGVTYDNDCIAFYLGGVTSWTEGICGTVGPCTDVEGLDFGPCDLDLGYAIVGGQCQSVTGCDYTADEINYSQAFYDNLSECMFTCEDLDCIEPELIDESILCAEIYDPVCGCDGVTYNNECEASNWYGVTEWTPGICGEQGCLDVEGIDFGPCEIFWGYAILGGQCTGISGCGTFVDGVEYGSNFYSSPTECEEACNEDCIDPAQIDLEHVCLDQWFPVCGCDSVTYVNDCVAYYFHGVTDYVSGPCPDPADCINTDNLDPEFGCYEIYDPVCGCDDITYSNDCYAFHAGVQSWVEGECTTSISEINTLNFKVYPNPFEDQLLISNQKNTSYSVTVVDLVGQEIFLQEKVNGQLQLETQTWSSGLYYLKLGDDFGQNKIFKILKN